jgi:hypothetical protein
MVLLTFAASGAARSETLLETFSKTIPDSAIRPAILEALNNVHTARCDGDKLCAATTQKEIENPPISLEDGRVVLTYGIVSALAQWCFLDWKRSFVPMMAYGRQKMGMNDRALAVVALMHGAFQLRQLAVFRTTGVCPDDLRTRLDTELPKL